MGTLKGRINHETQTSYLLYKVQESTPADAKAINFDPPERDFNRISKRFCLQARSSEKKPLEVEKRLKLNHPPRLCKTRRRDQTPKQ